LLVFPHNHLHVCPTIFSCHISAKQTQIKRIIRSRLRAKDLFSPQFVSWQVQQMTFCQPNNAREKSMAAAGKYLALD